MTVTVYSSSDPGAVAAGLYLTSTPGAGLAILDACLVNGYSGKAAAGWTKPFSGTDVGVYRMGGGNQRYLRVDDTNTQYATLCGYETMTGVNDGTGPFPYTDRGQLYSYWAKTAMVNTAIPTPIATVVPGSKQFRVTATSLAQVGTPVPGDKIVVTGNTDAATNGVYTLVSASYATSIVTLTVSETIPVTAANDGIVSHGYRPNWLIVATDKQFIMWQNWDWSNITNNFMYSYLYFFGDIVSYRPGDQYNTAIYAQNNSVAGAGSICCLGNMDVSYYGSNLARRYTQTGSSVYAMVTCNSSIKFSTMSGYTAAAGVPYPNPIDGSIAISPVWACETSATNPYVIRGEVPGLWYLGHTAPFHHGDIIEGTAGTPLDGKTFMAVSFNHSAANQYGQMLIEISDTW